jgi:hypothetical protein
MIVYSKEAQFSVNSSESAFLLGRRDDLFMFLYFPELCVSLSRILPLIGSFRARVSLSRCCGNSDDIVCPLVRERYNPPLTATENRRGTTRQNLRESAAFYALKYPEALLQHGDGGEKPTRIIKSQYCYVRLGMGPASTRRLRIRAED